MGIVENIFIKIFSGVPLDPRSTAVAVEKEGLEGDMSRARNSPRQILVARREDLDTFKLLPGNLRENLVISKIDEEQFSPGATLAIGESAQIFLTFRCEPCQRIAEFVPRLSTIIGRRGLLGIVTQEGTFHRGDSVRVVPSMHTAMSDEPMLRASTVISHIPAGRYMRYPDLLKAAGLQSPYFRVLPKYLNHALAAGLPAHRVLDSNFGLPKNTAHLIGTLLQELDRNDAAIAIGSATGDSIDLSSILRRDQSWTPVIADILNLQN